MDSCFMTVNSKFQIHDPRRVRFFNVLNFIFMKLSHKIVIVSYITFICKRNYDLNATLTCNV